MAIILQRFHCEANGETEGSETNETKSKTKRLKNKNTLRKPNIHMKWVCAMVVVSYAKPNENTKRHRGKKTIQFKSIHKHRENSVLAKPLTEREPNMN